MLLSGIIAKGAKEFYSAPALIFQDETLTYGELETAVERLAAGLLTLGVESGERISLLLPNCISFVVCYFAAARIGVVVVPANPLLKPAELEYIWRDSAVSLIIAAPPLLPGALTAIQNLPNIKNVVSLALNGTVAKAENSSESYVLSSLPELIAMGAASLDSSPLTSASLFASEDDCAVIIYTSGTTGFPKGAMLSHRNLIRNVEQVTEALDFKPQDVFLTVLPLFHAFAATVCMNTCLFGGCASVLMESFAPAKALEAVRRHRVTILPSVPAIFNAFLATSATQETFATVRMFVSGGAPLPVSTLHALEARYQVPVLEGDGPTECSPVTSVNPLGGVRKAGSVGLPLPGVEIAICDDEDKPLPRNEIGEIVVRGDNVMIGYLNQPEATSEAMKGGWYHTGDIGKIDSDGYVFILERKKDMIITSGSNVYPREVEEVLFGHPAVADAAVIGLPDALRGEEVVAVIVLKPGSQITERELGAYCRERMATYKAPRKVLFRETLPKGGTGKTVKRLLKKELEMEGRG